MARMTASDMVTEARASLGGETTESITNNQILRWLNRAYAQIASTFNPYELETSTSITTSSGTAEYESTASDILKVISVIDDTNNVQMYPWTRWQYDQATQGDATNVTGTPVYWFISGVGSNNRRQFTLYPTPAGTYTVNVIYTKTPTELVLSPAATSAVVQEPWDESILYAAVSKGWAFLGDEKKSAFWQRQANDAAMIALKSSQESSWVGMHPGSVVGNALR